MEEYKFYKESTGQWYIDLPDYPGAKYELEMVCGADTMLDIISEGDSSVNLIISDYEFPDANKLEFLNEGDELISGAYYKLKYYEGFRFDLRVWLCDVTKFVFGEFPKIIYLKKI